MRIAYHPLALREALKAQKRYARQNPTAASRFRDSIQKAERSISASPSSWTRYLKGTQYYRLKKFPYMIIYRMLPHMIYVVAVAHAKRRPGYWVKRLK